MKVSNAAIFSRIWNKVRNHGLSFISSNGGTGKTTFFYLKLLRDAYKKGIAFHVFCRYAHEMEKLAERLITPAPTYSKRACRLLSHFKVKKNGDKFVYIVDDKNRFAAQVVNIFGQEFYKKYGNQIGAKRAVFDEVLAENGAYCPNEVNRFNRLIRTMARSNEYHVYCLYNNTNPDFEYFHYFGGKGYNSHVAASGALFEYFIAPQFEYFIAPQFFVPNRGNSVEISAQSIIDNTLYKNVYTKNQFEQYPVFFDNVDLHGAKTLFYLEVSQRLLRVREHGDKIYLCAARKIKPTKPVYSIDDPEQTRLPRLPFHLQDVIARYRDKALLKTDNINLTIFVNILQNRV